MIVGLLWLILCQLAGELVVRLFDLPVPGAVVGMLVLFVALLVRRPDEEATVMRAGEFLLSHLQLFFVPAGVGVVVYLTVLRDHALPLVLALVGSWLLGLLVVGWLTTWLLHRSGRAEVAGPLGDQVE